MTCYQREVKEKFRGPPLSELGTFCSDEGGLWWVQGLVWLLRRSAKGKHHFLTVDEGG